MLKKILSGHDSPDTAYVVDDYPYGYTLRTKIRYWVETSERFGQRFVSQTLKPGTDQWNRPKASTYTSFMVLFIDASNGHLYWAGWHPYQGPTELRAFLDEYGAGMTDESKRIAIELLSKYARLEDRRANRA